MKRTIQLKLKLTSSQSKALSELQELFSNACNEISHKAWEEKESNRFRLHHLCYYSVRSSFPQLGSQMACNAVAKVANGYKAKKHTQQIEFRKTASVHFDKKTYSLKNGVLSLYTLQGRIQVSFESGTFQEEYLKKGKVTEAELMYKKTGWFFNLVLDLPDPQPLKGETLLAVDFGENVIAATSSGKVIKGGTLRDKRDKFLSYRRRLQLNGSQSAVRRLRKVSGRERRHVRQVNHTIAKEIVQEAKRNNASSIVLEDLTNIRKRIQAGKKLRSRLHRWPFAQLREFVEYKAQAEGIQVLFVHPAFTSQVCSHCHSLGERQRHCFTCPTCGSRAHSDLNASRNLLWLAQSADRATGDVNHRYVAATLSCGQQSFRL